MGIQQLRVLQIGPFPPPHGGVAANLVAIRKYLRKQGFAAGVINLTKPRKENNDEVWSPSGAFNLVQLLFTLPYRIIHLHVGGGFGSRLLGLCLVVTSIPGTRGVLTFHSGGYPSSPEGRRAAPWSLPGFILRRFDRIICVNEEMVAMFQRFGVPENKIRLILPFALPEGVPQMPLTPELADFYARHQAVIITVGLLEPEYDLPRQIDAFELVRERCAAYGVGLVIIGSGTLDASLRAQAAKKAYKDHILICGDVPHAVTLRAIHEAALMWRTTLYDGDAVSVREALHLGLPVIATDNTMRPPGVTVIPVADTEALQQATFRQLGQPRQQLNQPNSGETNMAQTVALYEELVSG